MSPQGIRFPGNIRGAEGLVCDGEIEGRIEVDGLAQTASGGKVHGGVEGGSLTFPEPSRGCRDACSADAAYPCELKGDADRPDLVMAPGATLPGQVHIT
jgi:hypothetical protein